MTSKIDTAVLMQLGFNICFKLVEKGVLNQQEAAQVMTETANDARLAGEHAGSLSAGDALAETLESMAANLLGKEIKK